VRPKAWRSSSAVIHAARRPIRLLSGLLTKFIRNGLLVLTDARGTVHQFGGEGPGPTVHVRLCDPALHTKLLINPELHAGEAYMDGTLVFAQGSTVGDLLNLFSVNRSGLGAHTSQTTTCRLTSTDCSSMRD
jgi:cyclopropane-fatty-acyl-phospholipid synthase